MAASRIFFVLLALGPAFCMEEKRGLSQKAPVPAAHNLSPPLPTLAFHAPPHPVIATPKSTQSLTHRARSRRQRKGEKPRKKALSNSGAAEGAHRPMDPSWKFFKVIHLKRRGVSPDHRTLHGPSRMNDFRKKGLARHARGSLPCHRAKESLDAGHRRFRRDHAEVSCTRNNGSHSRHRKGLKAKKAIKKRYERARGHKKKRHTRISELKSNNRLPRSGLQKSMHAAHSTPLDETERSHSDEPSSIATIRVKMIDAK